MKETKTEGDKDWITEDEKEAKDNTKKQPTLK